MFKTQVFHCKVLNILWRHFYGLQEGRPWKIVVDLFFTSQKYGWQCATIQVVFLFCPFRFEQQVQ